LQRSKTFRKDDPVTLAFLFDAAIDSKTNSTNFAAEIIYAVRLSVIS